MRELSDQNFGTIIAYLLPGFVTLNGLSFISPTIAQWLAAPPHSPSISGFLFVLLGSLGVGLTLSAVRWAFLDTLHAVTGVACPEWNFELLQERLDAFYALVISHYRYYQFYANMFFAVPIWIACRLARPATENSPLTFVAVGLVLEGILFAGSRDSLRKYHSRGTQLLQSGTKPILYLP